MPPKYCFILWCIRVLKFPLIIVWTATHHPNTNPDRTYAQHHATAPAVWFLALNFTKCQGACFCSAASLQTYQIMSQGIFVGQRQGDWENCSQFVACDQQILHNWIGVIGVIGVQDGSSLIPNDLALFWNIEVPKSEMSPSSAPETSSPMLLDNRCNHLMSTPQNESAVRETHVLWRWSKVQRKEGSVTLTLHLRQIFMCM